jgi:sulfopyruvate decarboxylase subunit alpha
MSPADFVALLRAEGFDFFTGVPCSLVKGVIAELEGQGDYVPETREDAALGLAAGAYLGGKRPVVLMQNSGFGVSINALTSLHLIYRLPCLLVVTWRGHRGTDAPEHIIMGEVCEPLMDTIGLPHCVPDDDGVADAVRWARGVMQAQQIPAALLVRKGVLG